MKKLFIGLGSSILLVGSLSLAQVPGPSVTAMQLKSVTGTMPCTAGAVLSVQAEVSGGSLGGTGTIRVLAQDGTKLGSSSVTVSASKTASIKVTTSFSGCSKANSLFNVEFTPDGGGTKSNKFLGAGVVSFIEAATPP